jgi:predicted RNA binding protein YcfA (HicA-like mRNA interferase family)
LGRAERFIGAPLDCSQPLEDKPALSRWFLPDIALVSHALFPMLRLWDAGSRSNTQLGRSMKVRDAIRLIEQDGWFLIATRGSHRQYKHPFKPGRVTIAGNASDDLAPGTLNSILKQSGLKEPH